MEWIFIVSLLAIVYTYLGYPLLLAFLRLVRKKPINAANYMPTVTIIIPNHNEKDRIAAKLDSCLQLDYPRELLEIIVASDCSTDGSDAIVASFADRGVWSVRLEQRQGKHYAQGRALQTA